MKECYTWLKGWKAAPTHTIAGIEELHQQLLPTKIYHQKKTGVNTTDDIMCRMCGEKPECLAHVLTGCVLAQTKCLSRHNAALKIPFFEMLKDMDLIESNPPWYSPVQPKPVYENDKTEAYWDVPVYAESTVVKSNPSGCAYSRQREEGGVTHGNDVSVDRKLREKKDRKYHKVCTT